MFIIVTVIFIIIAYYSFDIIKNAIFYYSNTNNKSFQIGNPWFFGLLIVNLIIMTFVIYFYNHKSTIGSIGRTGLGGYPGKKGLSGEEAYVSVC